MDKKLLLEAAENPDKRAKIFYDLGQTYLNPLFDRELEEATYSIFEFFLHHMDKWKGEFTVPVRYHRESGIIVFGDIWHTIRDYVSWCILYPQEVSTYFQVDDKSGNITVKENPKIRIIDKDNKKEVYKTELGKKFLVEVKKDRETLIDSGFTLGQKDSILTVCIIGLMALPPGHRKIDRSEVKPKKIIYSKEEKAKAKELIKEAMGKEKISIKDTAQLSLILLTNYRSELTLNDAKKELKNFLKAKNEKI